MANKKYHKALDT